MSVGSVTAEENTVVESVVGSDTLSYLVNREPCRLAKLELERLEDLASALLAEVLGGVATVVLLLAVGTLLGLELDVKAAL